VLPPEPFQNLDYALAQALPSHRFTGHDVLDLAHAPRRTLADQDSPEGYYSVGRLVDAHDVDVGLG
jgi:hypothetical protein